MPEPSLAYLSQSRLHLCGGGATDTIDSAFGRSLRDRAAQIHNRHAWKTQGSGARFMSGAMWGVRPGDPGEFRIAITSVARGRNPGELLYSLETDSISGIFAVDAAGVEQRLFHTNDFRVRHMALNPDGTSIAASIVHNDFTANIAVLQVEGPDFFEASEGDSFDLAPRWAPGPGRRLVFQSAGVGRDGGGRFSGLGPFTVQQIDLDSGEMECLAEEPEHDLLAPQKDGNGALYYIRRPYAGGRRNASPLRALLDAVLFPFRLLHAIFQYFSFFSMRYTGKPLTTSQGGAQRQPDLKQMMIWGNLIDAERAAREDRLGDPDAPSLVPSSWQLVRRSPDGATQVLAKSVLSFDLGADGAIVYSNGSAIHRIGPGGGSSERMAVGSMIEQVVAL
ncbi:MAG: hypothetical protein ABSH46_23080 [Bryobacteraceae bacterium]